VDSDDGDRVIAEVTVSADDRLAGAQIARKRHPSRWALPVFAAVLSLVAVLVHDWVLAALLGASAIGFDIYSSYAVRRSWQFQRVDSQVVRVTPEAVVVSSRLGRSELAWEAVTDVVAIPPLLVFERRRGQLLVLPLSGLSQDQVVAIAAAHAAARSRRRPPSQPNDGPS
jgi:hypothetical protein